MKSTADSVTAYQQLEALFTRLYHLAHVDAICSWDEAVKMPRGGGSARAKAVADLRVISHELLLNDSLMPLVEQAEKDVYQDPWQMANLAWMKRRLLTARSVPSRLTARLSERAMVCEQAWRQMRQDNDWQAFRPKLKETFLLAREVVEYKGQALGLSAYDAALDEFSPGLSQSIIDPIFGHLAEFLPPFLTRVRQRQAGIERAPLEGHYPVDKQYALSKALMRCIGFDFEHGRLDVSHHPFCGGVSEDVRITTRFDEKAFLSSVMAVCHETGHAMYERQLPEQWVSQPVGQALGMAMHESQSLLIEMQVCRSAEFMEVLSPLLAHHFGENEGFEPQNLYQHYCHVSPGLIRVDADEVSYPLHIILRYELERALFDGSLAVDDLAEAWDDKMQSYLGLSTTGDFRNGVMQDVHWPSGAFGYFPAYTLGAMIAAQCYQSAMRQVSGIQQGVAKGDFTPLMRWLRDNIHAKGSLLPFQALLQEVSGEALNVNYFIDHLKARYGD